MTATSTCERPRRRWYARCVYFPDAFDRQSCRSREHDHRNRDCRKRLGLSMAIRMRIIGRTSSKTKSHPHCCGTRNIQRGFDSICNECAGMANPTGKQLSHCKNHIDRKPKCSEFGSSP